MADKIELENRVKSLNNKLTSVEAERNKHETEAQEAIVGIIYKPYFTRLLSSSRSHVASCSICILC